MNWSVLAKRGLFFVSSFYLLLFISACETADEIGFGLVPQGDVGVLFSDTLTVEASTVLGRIPTEGAVNLLAGHYQDPTFGEVEANSYFQLVADSLLLINNSEDFDLIYDSLIFVASFQYSYPDTAGTQTFQLHALTEDLNEDVDYTNDRSVSFDPNPITSISVPLDDVDESRTIQIRMDDQLGLALFDLADNNTSREDYLDMFKGYALIPEQSEDVIGFPSNSVAMILYYSERRDPSESSDTLINRTLVFSALRGLRFNQISSDRTGTMIEELQQPFSELKAEQTDQNTYLQTGVGLQTKIAFPTLENLNNLGSVAINRAELIIRPLFRSTEGFRQPPNLVLYETNETNQVQTTTVTSGTSEVEVDLLVQRTGANPFGFNSPLVMSYNTRFEEYRADITNHLQLILTGDKTNEALLISGVPEDLAPQLGVFGDASLVNRLLINAREGDSFGVRLRLFYTVFN